MSNKPTGKKADEHFSPTQHIHTKPHADEKTEDIS